MLRIIICRGRCCRFAHVEVCSIPYPTTTAPVSFALLYALWSTRASTSARTTTARASSSDAWPAGLGFVLWRSSSQLVAVKHQPPLWSTVSIHGITRRCSISSCVSELQCFRCAPVVCAVLIDSWNAGGSSQTYALLHACCM